MAQGKAKPYEVDYYNYAKRERIKGGIAPPKKKKKLSGTSETRVHFSAMCNSLTQQGGASKMHV